MCNVDTRALGALRKTGGGVKEWTKCICPFSCRLESRSRMCSRNLSLRIGRIGSDDVAQSQTVHLLKSVLWTKVRTCFSTRSWLPLASNQRSLRSISSAALSELVKPDIDTQIAVVVKVHRSSTWVKVQIRILKYYSSKSKSTAFSILLEWKYKSTPFFMYLSKKVLIDRFILQFYIDYFI